MSPPARSAALFCLLLALSLRPGECGIAAAAGGAAYVLRGSSGGEERQRDEETETVIMFVMATMVALVGLIGILVAICAGKRRYDFQINDPPKNYVVDKTVKCISGSGNIRESFC